MKRRNVILRKTYTHISKREKTSGITYVAHMNTYEYFVENYFQEYKELMEKKCAAIRIYSAKHVIFPS